MFLRFNQHQNVFNAYLKINSIKIAIKFDDRKKKNKI